MTHPHTPAARARRALAAALAAAVLVATGAAGARQPDGLLVTPAWLAAHLRDPALVLLHVGDEREYDAGHIPGARRVELSDVAADERGDNVLEMPGPDALRAKLERLGISDDSRVVVYFAGDRLSPATRVIFALDYFGLGGRTALLDGGLGAWTREGRPTTTEVPPARAASLTARAPRPLVVDPAWVQRHAGARATRIVDARAPAYYDGPARGSHRAGHIPGAVNLPFSAVAGADLRLKDADALRGLFRAAGVQPGDTVAAYCHIGQQATAVLFAARLLGHPVRLYDGSFEDWSRRTALPVEGGRP